MKGISGDLFAYTSTGHAFAVIVKVEGIQGLYKGMWPNLLKVNDNKVTYKLKGSRITKVAAVILITKRFSCLECVC